MATDYQNLPLTPYHFSANNPITYVDPDGLNWYVAEGEGDQAKPVWFEKETQAQEHFGEQEFKDLGKEVHSFNAETGNQVYYGDEGGIFELPQMLSEVEIDGGRMSDHARTMQNPIVQAVHQGQRKFADYSYEYPIDYVLALSDFMNAYSEMREANWVNSDKYFHSKANFNASRRGPGGEAGAVRLSNLREIIDQRIKGDSRKQSVMDQRANNYGRRQGRSYRYGRGRVNYSDVLSKYRPGNLPSRY